jgi:hypothetical protein
VAVLIEQHGGVCQVTFRLRQRAFYLQADTCREVIGPSGRRLASILKLLAARLAAPRSELRASVAGSRKPGAGALADQLALFLRQRCEQMQHERIGLSAQTGGQVLISWNSTNATTCTASGGSGSDGWGGNVALAGNASLRESTAGTYKFTLQCTGSGVNVSADTSVAVTPAPSSGSSGSEGGGGSMDWGELLALLILGVGRAVFQAARSNRRLTADGILLF